MAEDIRVLKVVQTALMPTVPLRQFQQLTC